ncbi:hypothetical protein [Streptomyces albipurpureus]|uniref:Uncharacterized protein n=1 Tax=Streptomyces albipurpureus TaxID=2897419 RepID=A0ABT0UN81_9ACTN|nr:hypothetical protein [Streptomyces sp. CWNU-1]MCM2389777.1 hypothetical protein [Streptomyces sp. CWNU-1]
MTSWIDSPVPHHEANVVFARGIPRDELTRGLGDRLREPLASGEGNGWVWAAHDMHNREKEDYGAVDYASMCPGGAEIVVFVTEPCSPKGFPPEFEYYRDGRLILCFSFEDLQQRVGENPDYLSAELLAAHLIGPNRTCGFPDCPGDDCLDHFDVEHRLVEVITDAFSLPAPSLPPEVRAK